VFSEPELNARGGAGLLLSIPAPGRSDPRFMPMIGWLFYHLSSGSYCCSTWPLPYLWAELVSFRPIAWLPGRVAASGGDGVKREGNDRVQETDSAEGAVVSGTAGGGGIAARQAADR
jgi:hypothetical protein